MDKNKEQRILVIRLSAMGDVAMTIPVLLAFKRTYPTVRISVLTRPFLAKMFHSLDVEVIPIDTKGAHKGIIGLLRLSRTLKKYNFSAVADLHNVLRTKILKLFLFLSPVPFEQIDKGRAEKKALTRTGNKIFRPLKTTIERYTEVFEKLGFPLQLQYSDVLERQEIPQEITKELGVKKSAWIGIAPFAAHQGKQYPIEQMETVIEELAKERNTEIMLFGAPGMEAKELEKLEAAYPGVYNMAGKIEFDKELALISNLDVMLAMDSGNGHLAAAYGVPVITLWGVTHPYAGFAPFGQPESHSLLADREKYPEIPTSVFGNKWPEGYEKCMGIIPPSLVIQTIRESLDQAKVLGAKERR